MGRSGRVEQQQQQQQGQQPAGSSQSLAGAGPSSSNPAPVQRKALSARQKRKQKALNAIASRQQQRQVQSRDDTDDVCLVVDQPDAADALEEADPLTPSKSVALENVLATPGTGPPNPLRRKTGKHLMWSIA